VVIERGTKIGRFVVVAELGAGGMGAVFAAHDPELDRQVALKLMKGSGEGEEDRVRMLREGQAMARVTHANVITVYEVGVEDGAVFLAQELLDGGTLTEWLEEPRPQHEIIDKFIAAGRGLAAAHAAGLVHRDFKPDNVLLGTDGRVRVADFGLARALGRADDQLAATVRGGGPSVAGDASSKSPMTERLTRTGAVMGTPMYMAPEQHRGERADARSDQFSFCVALYHALYGAWPFPGKTAVALADAVIAGRMQPPPRGRRVPVRLRRLLARGLRTDPAERYPSMAALLAELAAPPRSLGRIGLATGALALAGGALVTGFVLSRGSTPARAEDPAGPAFPGPVAPELLTSERGLAWLTAAIERGQLDDAIEKYDLAAALGEQARDDAQAAIARAGGAFARVLRGELREAEQRLTDVERLAGDDASARAYVDLAGAAIAAAKSEPRDARERGERCALAFAASAPVLASVCAQLYGKAAADLGDAEIARTAYRNGLEIAREAGNVARTSALELALAELALDAGDYEEAAASASGAQRAAAGRGAVSQETHANVVLARALLGKGANQDALEVLERPQRDTQTFAVGLAHRIALGLAHAFLGDPTTGLEHIDGARAEAERRGYAELALEARLARISVLIAEAPAEAAADQRALAAQARARGHARIARLAETADER
jgi:hypothetical protein